MEAALRALGDDRSRDRPALSAVRAVAAGAVLYTAGRFLREQLSRKETAVPEPSRAREEREARRERSRPSLDLPQQRWPRMAAGRR